MLQKLVGMPSTHNLKEAVQNYQIRNCPITTDDIIIAETIDDPQIPIIKGKSIRRISEYHKTIPRIPFTPLMAKHNHNVDLAMYFSL